MSHRSTLQNFSVTILSEHLRQDAKKELEVKHQKRNIQFNFKNSHTLPSMSPKKHSTFADTLSSYSRNRSDTVGRLSGSMATINSSGLFSERVTAIKPLALCVRCGSHASICMSCSEEECDRAVTFYRKSRAAGAATLFTRAFIEVGNAKVIKFIVFRLLKNSFQNRTREQMKKKTVVEKLFGTNLVCIPFAAWRRFTKENILNRKDKAILKLNDRVK